MGGSFGGLQVVPLVAVVLSWWPTTCTGRDAPTATHETHEDHDEHEENADHAPGRHRPALCAGWGSREPTAQARAQRQACLRLRVLSIHIADRRSATLTADSTRARIQPFCFLEPASSFFLRALRGLRGLRVFAVGACIVGYQPLNRDPADGIEDAMPQCV